MEVLIGRLETNGDGLAREDPSTQADGATTSSGAPPQGEVVQPAAEPVEFSVGKRVRCPGGGDLFGRERNNRSGIVEFKAPETTWITEAHIRPVETHYGASGDVQYDLSNPDAEGVERKIRGWVRLSCDPPNYAGAPGGWMEVELYGKHTSPRQ